VPGVPREYRHLVEHEVLPRLRALLEGEQGRVFRAFRLLKTVNLPESHLDALVAPIAARHPKVVFGFRTHAPENHLKLMAESPSQVEADAALAACDAECRAAVARWLFGEADQTLASAVASLLRARKQTVALAESCTGGLAAALCTAEAGASDWFLGSAVAYQPSLKQTWASVRAETLERFGAVSGEVAMELARGVRGQAGASYGVSITGYAGPTGGTAQDPVGTVYLGLADGDGRAGVERHSFIGDRERVRQFAAHHALDFLRRALKGELPAGALEK
jgi:nicotinamide-nucleotide amidase